MWDKDSCLWPELTSALQAPPRHGLGVNLCHGAFIPCCQFKCVGEQGSIFIVGMERTVVGLFINIAEQHYPVLEREETEFLLDKSQSSYPWKHVGVK